MADGDRIVSRFSFRMRQLKKKLKRWRRPIWALGAVLFIVGLLTIGAMLSEKVKQWSELSGESVSTLASLADTNINNTKGGSSNASTSDLRKEQVAQLFGTSNSKLSVIHRKQYICGTEDQYLGQQSRDEVVQLLDKNSYWEPTIDQEKQVILIERIDDLSETCKRSAQMGMDIEGNLSLYDGAPSAERVIRTFFQIDIESMESSLPPQVLQQIKNGIRISDREEYISVLSTFSDFAVEDTKKVMKPTVSP
ncbi:BofC C-terminal domain-containing protein [Paenibacillus sp. SC116]|uniref:BofC C-terminal domain-containing protein n=1 Tax=Paenibacillus sp. SC116 TaxID=2968986 RepID=UPI00215B37E8|nr:BofC C-terminal domain-containing protein [Paenibacillus sp. SC116]MCR8846011.1 BofC C-terminal domain-containing protein [Paenibacillus sp. SC116]